MQASVTKVDIQPSIVYSQSIEIMSGDNQLCQVCGDTPFFYCTCQDTLLLCTAHAHSHISKDQDHTILPITPSGMSLVPVGPGRELERKAVMDELGQASDRLGDFVRWEMRNVKRKVEEYREMFLGNFNASIDMLKTELNSGYSEVLKELTNIKKELALTALQPEFTLSQATSDFLKAVSHFSTPGKTFLNFQQLISTRILWDGSLEPKVPSSFLTPWLRCQCCTAGRACTVCIQLFTRMGLKQYAASSLFRPQYDRVPVSQEQEAATWSCGHCGHPYNLKDWQQCSKCGGKNPPSDQRTFRRIQSSQLS